ncbi:NTP transferase domain-containing protein [Halovenus sp. WSH3]|uniref:Bifunctional protein GlmU n=1 Tax=Halovenus carboxidivorans TaxID=2692199 RepID=A0A6B0TCL0_9EURY|nr:bifunctional sugar-1-phosphate nucleotidylyltransferase/acetyltransferase [Halovenus carboxidivorans]MXR50939.1 NTP transferase domain-containing protein [Halovenus carboxidivorans]
MEPRTAVVLAAGEGTRLRPLTQNRPKPMLPAANRPILEHVLDALVEAGIERIVLVVGYRRERVQSYVGPTYRDVPVEYAVQGKQLGSGHALSQAADVVSEPLLVVNGDRLIESSAVEAVATAFSESGRPAAMAVIERDQASRYGVVSLDGDEVTELVEKPDSEGHGLINAGVYAFEETIFEEIEATSRQSGELALTDTISRLIDRQAVTGVPIDGLWVDATYPWDLLSVAQEVFERGQTSEPESAPGVWVDNEVGVHEDATLQPPVVVGPDCEIAAGAVVGPNVALSRNVTVGPNATVERAVVDEDSRIGHGSTVIDAVIGQDTDLGVGTTIPGGPSDVRVGNQIHEEQQLGAVLADRVEVAGGVSFEPGTLVGTKATLGTGAHVRGHVPIGAEVVR